MLRPEVTAALQDVSLALPWELIERFARLPREHPDQVRLAAQEIVDRLERLGVPVTVAAPRLFLSLPGPARVTCGAASYRAKPMAMSRPVSGLTAPMIYLPNLHDPDLEELFDRPGASARDREVRGRIVVTEGFGMPGKVAHYESLGAAALIAVNPGELPHWGICTTIWGTPDLTDLARQPGIPVVAVNRPDGQALIAAAGRNEVASITAELEQGWFDSPVPIVRIPGTEEPGAFVLLHGHYDAWDVGVGDNAVGNAALLEIARVLWQHRAALRRSVWIAWWPGHSTGRYAGSTWFADQFALELDESCIAQVNCDSPGCRWATEYLDVAWMPETEDLAKRVIRQLTGKDAEGVRPFQAGDYSFNNIGISSFFMLLSTMSPEARAARGYYAVGGCGGNIAWHTEEDTLEIADREVLRADIGIYLAAVMEVANATIAPFDFTATLDDFDRTLEAYQAAAGDRFSFDAARREVEALRGPLARLAERAVRLAARSASDPEVRRLNHALRRLARHLVPVNFTTRARFFHDPAETIPPLPDLAPARELDSWPPDRLGFAVAHLMRGQNRLVAALREARREVEAALG